MSGVNQVIILGNLGADPEMRYMQGGDPVTECRVAVSRQWTGKDGQRQEETEWFTVVCYSKLAEIANQYLRKGRKVYFQGRLRTRSWDGDDGKKHYKTEVVAETMQLIDRPVESGAGAPRGRREDDPVDQLPF